MKHYKISEFFDTVLAMVSPERSFKFVVFTSPKHDLRISPGEFFVTRNFSRNGLEHLRRVF